MKAQQTDDKKHLDATTGYNIICTVLGEGNATTLKAAKKELDDKKVALDKHLISLVAAVDNQLLEVRAAGNCEALDLLKTEVKDTHVIGMKANVIKEFAQTLASFRKSCDQIQTGPGATRGASDVSEAQLPRVYGVASSIVRTSGTTAGSSMYEAKVGMKGALLSAKLNQEAAWTKFLESPIWKKNKKDLQKHLKQNDMGTIVLDDSRYKKFKIAADVHRHATLQPVPVASRCDLVKVCLPGAALCGPRAVVSRWLRSTRQHGGQARC